MTQKFHDEDKRAGAAKMFLDAKVQEFTGQTLIGNQTLITRTREEAHDLLDRYLDATSEQVTQHIHQAKKGMK